MQTILTIVQVFLSLGLIGLVLIQHGRGADAGAAFGSGASATVFGSRGSGSFLSRTTGILAALFFLTSMALAYYAAQGGKPAGLMDAVDGMPVPVEPKDALPPVAIQAPASEVPVVPAPAGAAGQSSGSDVPTVLPASVAKTAADGAGAAPASADKSKEEPKEQPK